MSMRLWLGIMGLVLSQSLVQAQPTPAMLIGDYDVPEDIAKLKVVNRGYLAAIYKNGEPVDASLVTKTKQGAATSVYEISTPLGQGDWVVFHLVHNPVDGDEKYFGAVGLSDAGDHLVSSHSKSEDWCSCSYPSLADKFISERKFGIHSRALALEASSEVMGQELIPSAVIGEPIWGTASSTWLKYIVPEKVISITGDILVDSDEAEVTGENGVWVGSVEIAPEPAAQRRHYSIAE
ncbi:MAG: hypothetical protein AAF226_12865 [Verrucomicrobiota bacterium]